MRRCVGDGGGHGARAGGHYVHGIGSRWPGAANTTRRCGGPANGAPPLPTARSVTTRKPVPPAVCGQEEAQLHLPQNTGDCYTVLVWTISVPPRVPGSDLYYAEYRSGQMPSNRGAEVWVAYFSGEFVYN